MSHVSLFRTTLLGVALVVSACSGDPAAQARAYEESGDKYVAAGKHAEAAVDYRNALKHDPRSGRVRLKLADSYSRTNEPAKAYQEYLRAADLMPDDRDAQLKAAGGLLLAGQYDEAKRHAERVVQRNPRDADALLILANALAGLKDLDAAIDQVEEAITLDPHDPRRQTALGSIYIARGDAKRAEDAFKKALELKPRDHAVLLALGNFYWAAGRMPEAEQTFLEAYRQSPEALSVNRALATLYASTRRMPMAEPYLKRAVTSTPGFRPQLALADYYVSLGRTSEAEQILRSLITHRDALFEAKGRLATIGHAAGRTDQAYAMLDEVLRDDPRNLRARLLKVRMLIADKRGAEAATVTTEALEIDPTSAAAHYMNGLLLEAKGDRIGARRAYSEVLRLNPRAIQAQLRLSTLSLQEGTLDLAVQFASEALNDDPVNDEARMSLARALLARHDTVGADKEISVLLARYPSSPSVQTLAGLLKTQQGAYEAARTLFMRSLAGKQHSPEALAGLLTVDAATGKLEQSRARIASSIAAVPGDVQLLLVSARAAVLRRDWPDAEQVLRRAIALDSSNLMAYAMLGSAYANQGRLDEARREFEQLADHDPSSVAAPTMVGVLLHTQNRLDETKVWYERALRLDPGAAVAANNLAWIYAESGGDLNQALQLAEAAAARLPKNPEVHDTLGWVRYRRGEFQLALPPLTKSVEQAPANPDYLYHLGLAQAGAGQKDKARESLRRALALKPDFGGASDAKRVLSGL